MQRKSSDTGGALLDVLPFREHITCTTDRDDPARMFRIVFQSRTDPGHVHIKAAVECFCLVPAQLVHERVA